MSRMDPPCPQGNRTRIDLRYTELLEALDAAHDIHHGINGPDFVQSNVLSSHPVDPPLGLAQKSKGLYCSIAHPVRYVGALHKLDQICDVAMAIGVWGGHIVMVVVSTMCVVRGIWVPGMMMAVSVLEGPGWKFLNLTREDDIDLDRAYAATQHGSGLYLDLGKSEPRG
jgi:hypothetical protein